MTARPNRILRLIALFRLAKAVLLIASGLGVLRLLEPGVAATTSQWLAAMPFAAQHAFTRKAISIITGLPPRRIEELAIVAFLYAALFTTEGIGLWLGKVWAEWLTIIATASLIPFEVYEVFRKPRPLRMTILAANIAIVVYLARLRRLKSS